MQSPGDPCQTCVCSHSGSPLVTLVPEEIPKGRPWSRSGFWVGRIGGDLGRTEQTPRPRGCTEAFCWRPWGASFSTPALACCSSVGRELQHTGSRLLQLRGA